MRLPGDPACFIELVEVSVDPADAEADARGFLSGARASVSRGMLAGTWTATVRGGELGRFLVPGEEVVISGVNAATGDRFTVPATLICEVAGRPARFAERSARRATSPWEMGR